VVTKIMLEIHRKPRRDATLAEIIREQIGILLWRRNA